MSDNKWHSGPPPSVGWWPASISKNAFALRWWDGKTWSLDVYEGWMLETVKHRASIKCSPHGIFWKHRPKSWPKRSFT